MSVHGIGNPFPRQELMKTFWLPGAGDGCCDGCSASCSVDGCSMSACCTRPARTALLGSPFLSSWLQPAALAAERPRRSARTASPRRMPTPYVRRAPQIRTVSSCRTPATIVQHARIESENRSSRSRSSDAIVRTSCRRRRAVAVSPVHASRADPDPPNNGSRKRLGYLPRESYALFWRK